MQSARIGLVVIETTFSSMREAKTIASLAIRKKLAACVHIAKIKSMYKWKGKIEETNEIKLTFKTSNEQATALFEFLQANHSYEVPEILAFRVHNSLQEYANWVIGETKNQIKRGKKQ